MTDLGFEALSVLLVLLPGFVSAKIVQSLCVRPLQTELDKVVEALLYSFLVYVSYALFVGIAPLRIIATSHPNGSIEYAPHANGFGLLYLLAISVLLGVAIAGCLTNDFPTRLFRQIRLTQRTTRSSVWSDVFHDWAHYVQVQFCDGRRILGWPRYYSDTPEESALFLEGAAWVDKDGKATDIPGPGILITKNMQIESIMFLFLKESPFLQNRIPAHFSPLPFIIPLPWKIEMQHGF